MLNYIALFGFLGLLFYVFKRILDRADQQSHYIMNHKDPQSYHASFKKPHGNKPTSKDIKGEKDKLIDNTWDEAYLSGQLTKEQAKILGMDVDAQ